MYMMSRSSPQIAAIAAALALGCNPPENRATAADPPGDSEDNLHASDAEAAIREQETRWRDVLAKRDTAAIRSFYTEDGVYAPDNAQMAYHGRDSVSARWSRELGRPEFRLERTPGRIDVASSGDLAQEVGTYVVRLVRDGKPYEGHGNYMTAWRKEGGDWKIAAYIWNADREGHDQMATARRAR
jgi:ketosteroid isomerase-like protein